MTGSSVDSRRDVVRLAVLVGAIGVVFGDIGTSPIYTLQTVFNPTDPHPVPVTEENVLGVVSLTFWSVVLIVTVTYVLLAMRVDNDGEAGIMALITLLLRRAPGSRARLVRFLVGLGVLGASLFLGDSMITPAISVLSAVEGLKVVDPGLEHFLSVLLIPAGGEIALIGTSGRLGLDERRASQALINVSDLPNKQRRSASRGIKRLHVTTKTRESGAAT
jgi:KUP system potassium uptake protein